MSYIKTWVERCDEHPDHQSGMVSNGMIQARMQEEIADLRAEIERLRASLKPFAALYLWPDDIGDEWTVNDIRSGYDWDETENDTKTDDVFIKRGHIRAARKALEGKP